MGRLPASRCTTCFGPGVLGSNRVQIQQPSDSISDRKLDLRPTCPALVAYMVPAPCECPHRSFRTLVRTVDGRPPFPGAVAAVVGVPVGPPHLSGSVHGRPPRCSGRRGRGSVRPYFGRAPKAMQPTHHSPRRPHTHRPGRQPRGVVTSRLTTHGALAGGSLDRVLRPKPSERRGKAWPRHRGHATALAGHRPLRYVAEGRGRGPARSGGREGESRPPPHTLAHPPSAHTMSQQAPPKPSKRPGC